MNLIDWVILSIPLIICLIAAVMATAAFGAVAGAVAFVFSVVVILHFLGV